MKIVSNVNKKRITNGETRKLMSSQKICSKIIEYGTLGLIIFAPLPAASVSEWSILVIELTVLVLMAAYLIIPKKSQPNELLLHSLKWPKIFFTGLFAFLFIQILPLPKFLVKILSPNTYSFQENFMPDFSRIKFISLSIIPTHTLQKALELLAYLLLGFLIIKTITERHQIKRIFSVLIALGTFEALYGMFELYNPNPRILFYKKTYGLDSVTGTFVNRNHLSGYLEMIIPLAIGLIIARANILSLSGSKWRQKILRLSEKGYLTNLLISITVIIMSLGIIFSNSRSGVFLLIFTFILFFELTVLYFGRSKVQKIWIKNFLKVAFLIIIFIALYIGIENTIERFALNKLLTAGRPIFWANTVKIFSSYPLFGTGLGTFPSLYPDMESGGQIVRLYHAHNDYLEYLTELGIVGMIFLLGGILYMAINSFLIWRTRRHPEIKGLGLGGIIAVICMLLHSLTDFNLHIPANMLLFSIVLSLTTATVFYKRK